MERMVYLCIFFFFFILAVGRVRSSIGESHFNHRSKTNKGLCSQLIQPSGYPCSEHTVQTKDGHLLALQRVSSRNNGDIRLKSFGPPIFLQHGLFTAGDSWFLNSVEQSLGFILADQGFDVWVGNVRGTHWSHGHISLSEKDKEFWDWSWQELALYDLAEMIKYVHSITNSKVFFVGHSQGTIMALAAFTQSDVVDMVEAAALLCPISYLGHISAKFVLRLVGLHLDKMILAMGIHQLNFRSDFSVQMLDSICVDMECDDLLSSLTERNTGVEPFSIGGHLQFGSRGQTNLTIDNFKVLMISAPCGFNGYYHLNGSTLDVSSRGVLSVVSILAFAFFFFSLDPSEFFPYVKLSEKVIMLIKEWSEKDNNGKNCCFNNSRVEFYLQYEPHPSSSKNLNHLFQMIRTGEFAKYDYGTWGNLKRYGHFKAPAFDLSRIPKSLPLWIGYGGIDALADVTDVKHTLKELQSQPELLYIDSYGHIDFILSARAKEDVYDNMIRFFKSSTKSDSS